MNGSGCCPGCDAGGPCYDSGGPAETLLAFRAGSAMAPGYDGQVGPMLPTVAEYCPGSLVYADPWGGGGQTSPRYAAGVKNAPELGDILRIPPPLPCVDQLGVHPGMCFDTTIGTCVPCPTTGVVVEVPEPGPIPGLVTEQEAIAREREAFRRGQEEESGKFLKQTVLAAGITAVVGIAIGKLWR